LADAEPCGFSAVRTATTDVTPSISRTIFSAACRSGSSSVARSAGTVMENDAAILQQDLRYQPQVDDVALHVGSPDPTQAFDDRLPTEAHYGLLKIATKRQPSSEC
jgi:hypothetical protein